jgi:drug/metabolite transporter (DMT)-like permease
MMVMIVTGLAAAGLYGAAAALEQRQAERVPDESAGKLALLGQLARNPLWLLGFAAQFAGFGVHAVALRSGPLDTVQMLVAAELIVAVMLVQIWSGRKLNPTSSAAALTVVAGIAAFLFLTTPGGHAHSQGHGMPRLSLVAAVVLGIAATALVLAGLRAAGHRRAILLALAAGAGDACSAVVTMAFTHVIGHGLASVMTSWTTYAVIVAGIANILLTQTAYQAGQPLVTLPLISAFVPVASVAVGVGLLGEAPRVSLASGVGACIAVLVTGVALAVLARSVPAQPVSARPAPVLPVPTLPVPAQPTAAVSARSGRAGRASHRPALASSTPHRYLSARPVPAVTGAPPGRPPSARRPPHRSPRPGQARTAPATARRHPRAPGRRGRSRAGPPSTRAGPTGTRPTVPRPLRRPRAGWLAGPGR